MLHFTCELDGYGYQCCPRFFYVCIMNYGNWTTE